jgi:hypothetical protein
MDPKVLQNVMMRIQQAIPQVPTAFASNASPLSMPRSHYPQFIAENPDIAGESYKQGQMGIFKDPIKEYMRTQLPVTNIYGNATEQYPIAPDIHQRAWNNASKPNMTASQELGSGYFRSPDMINLKRRGPEIFWNPANTGDPNSNSLDPTYEPDPRHTSVPLTPAEQQALRVEMYKAAAYQDPNFNPNAFWNQYTTNMPANPWMQQSFNHFNSPFYDGMPQEHKARILFGMLGAKYGGAAMKNTPILGPYYQGVLK